ncbi:MULTISPECIES: MFS transporter [unclassified Nostoc]|uniref:MFS transporter n=1 Tax=unclassified Nostoc TaxID=2593658 RepID=UPI0025AAB104|nr:MULTISPECIES: MFS transporter [unclassified Nostoc]MDM9584324.1 MFS transporter [Nostoc sp. GT001]MDZ7947156.1 MFS transporter [Nostoc sp. EfeVER01]MDZ7996138.1 MFS transporter [Nostoc sp. EspVER01]
MLNSEIQKDLRHNFTVSVIESGFFGFGSGFASFFTILPLFVSTLTDSALLIGLIPAIPRLGWQLPQLLTANKVARLQCYKPTVMLLTIHQKLPFLGLALVALLQLELNHQTILLLTFAILIWQGLGGGVSATAWQSMIAKIVPSRKLGIFYGTLAASGNFMSICGAAIAGLLLKEIAQPFNFALCFLCASLAMALSWFFMSRTREPVNTTSSAFETRREFWDSVGVILRCDENFRCFVIARMISQLALMPLPFYTLYAVHQYGMGEASVGLITTLLMVTQTIAGLVLGWLGDRTGRKLVLETGCIACAFSSVLACLAPNANWFYLVFIGAGIGMMALQNIAAVMTLEFGNQYQRPAYIGLGNTLVAPATILAPLLGGWIVENIDYRTTFLVAAIGALVTTLLLHVGVSDPRYLEENFSNDSVNVLPE